MNEKIDKERLLTNLDTMRGNLLADPNIPTITARGCNTRLNI